MKKRPSNYTQRYDTECAFVCNYLHFYATVFYHMQSFAMSCSCLHLHSTGLLGFFHMRLFSISKQLTFRDSDDSDQDDRDDQERDFLLGSNGNGLTQHLHPAKPTPGNQVPDFGLFSKSQTPPDTKLILFSNKSQSRIEANTQDKVLKWPE